MKQKALPTVRNMRWMQRTSDATGMMKLTLIGLIKEAGYPSIEAHFLPLIPVSMHSAFARFYSLHQITQYPYD